MKSFHGGKRSGAGRKRGTRWPSTIAKEQARELVRQAVTRELEVLIAAQIANAKGLSYLVVRDKATGKVLRVTETAARQKLGKGEELITVWDRDPNVTAYIDLMNRALDKPREQPHEIKVTGDDEQIRRLHAGRDRARAAKGQS